MPMDTAVETRLIALMKMGMLGVYGGHLEKGGAQCLRPQSLYLIIAH